MPTYYTLDGYSMLIKHHKLCLNIIFAGTILENPLKGFKSVLNQSFSVTITETITYFIKY